MENYDYSFDQLDKRDALFSSQLEDDGWVLYHATSSLAEDNIDRNGLRIGSCTTSTVQSFKILKVFRAMNWSGLDSEGYPVLRGFSSSRLASGQLYFREASTRSLIYAQRDFAGGENLRALYRALSDLHLYLERPDLREKHLQYQIAACRKLVQQSGCPTHVITVDTQWLRYQLEELKSLTNEIKNVRSAYRYGVVYAARFGPSDLPHLQENGGAGVCCFKDVPPEKLVGKARLHFGEHQLHKHFSVERVPEGRSRPGVVSSLQGTARGSNSVDSFAASELASEPGGFAGPDCALEIAERYGTPEIKSMVRSGKVVFNS
jgi:hypothetical protein